MITRLAVLFLLFNSLSSAAPQAPSASATATKAVAAAKTFLTTLDSEQRAAVNLELNAANRWRWSNLPSAVGYRGMRNGIAMSDLNPAQQDAALALIAATLTPAAYQTVFHILIAEEIRLGTPPPLHAGPGRVHFETAQFQIAVLGEPSIASPWMVQFGGHHLAINTTFAGGHIAFTPLHIGTEPPSYYLNGELIRPLGNETDKAFALINALNPAQQKQAILDHPVTDTVFGPKHDGEVIDLSGFALPISRRDSKTCCSN